MRLRPGSARRSVALLLVVGSTIVAGVCLRWQGTAGLAPLPVDATAYPVPNGATGPVAENPPQDIQELAIEVANGRFTADVYSMQRGDVRLRVTTRGGPYTLSVDPLLQRRELAADSTTTIAINAPDPGDYQMQLNTGAQATLDVRPIGGR